MSRVIHIRSGRGPEARFRIATLLGLACFALLSACAGTKSGADAPPPGLEPAQKLAKKAQETEDPDKAITLYQESITAYRQLPSVWNNLGILYMGKKQFLDAAEAFGNAAELIPKDPRPYYNLGLTWDRAGYWEDALRFYLRSLSVEPTYLPALRGAIRDEQRLNKGDEQTLERIRLALGQEPNRQWREFFELTRGHVEQELNRNATGSASSLPQRGGSSMYQSGPPAPGPASLPPARPTPPRP